MRNHTVFTKKQVEDGELKERYKMCALHGNKPIDLFCVECKKPCCLTGRATVHHLHECVTLDKQFSEFSTKLQQKCQEMKTPIPILKESYMKWTNSDELKTKSADFIVGEVNDLALEVGKAVKDDTEKHKNISAKSKKKIKEDIELIEGRVKEIETMLKKLTPGEMEEKEEELWKLTEVSIDVDNLPQPNIRPAIPVNRKFLYSYVMTDYLMITPREEPKLLTTFNAKTPSDKNKCRLTDALVFVSEQMYIAICDDCNGNNKVKVFGLNGKLHFESKPGLFRFDPSTLIQDPADKNSFLVANWNGALQKYNYRTENVSTYSHSLVNLGGIAMTNYNPQSAVVLGDGTVFDPFSKKVLTKYPIKEKPWDIAGHSSHTLIVVTQLDTNTVSAYESGKHVWTRGCNEGEGPYGVHVTSTGLSIVAYCQSHTIVLFSKSGQRIRTLLTKDHVTLPAGLFYVENNNLLVVTEEGSPIIKIFSVQL